MAKVALATDLWSTGRRSGHDLLVWKRLRAWPLLPPAVMRAMFEKRKRPKPIPFGHWRATMFENKRNLFSDTW
jgi:hypothetical protein